MRPTTSRSDQSVSLAATSGPSTPTAEHNDPHHPDAATSSDLEASPTAPATPAIEKQQQHLHGDDKLVTWAHGPPEADPDNPLGWSKMRKWGTVVVVSAASFCVTSTSSIISLAYDGIMQDFKISKIVSILGLSLFVAGLGLGPMFLAPLSEFYGRRPIYLCSFSAFFLLGFPVSFANNPAVFFIFRFLTGFGGSALLSVAGGSVSDCFDQRDLYIPMAVFTLSPFLGPASGSLLSGFINQNVQWRWSFWVINIWSACTLVAIYFFAPETYAPIILAKRARRLRKQTGDDKLYAQHERNIGQKSVVRTIATSCTRPFELLINEYMLALLCIWSALLLGLLYLLFIAFPIVFRQHGFNVQEVGLSFVGIGLGQLVALASMPYWARKYAAAREAGGGVAPPEARLPVAMAGALIMPVGLFAFAFTSYASVPWIVPILASILIGLAIGLTYISIFSFTVDAYRPVAASAMAANSIVRSSWAAAFPLFAGQMYSGLGVVGASALLAGLNVLMVPLPFLFYRYGARIRAKSKFTNSAQT
ncbi:uncharacterized protein PFL1_01876 [Pseudozyma flocculosa PF-1]|uniref:Related to multidrug resistant protein n=1 Tax=Pseudozyma flocculosa TaxID=84751 RepID=A0A5C3F1Q3_9BASI|nr:uncharacterized protein PFL1_01876 [Pseudozyma flocculosa PF-1]EPQ30350.1 hypothetical protein PFL1_01876 [Pseudozyma flocculosa PF-1]SPO37419.1 related to multidrug resistant protein [Pseudozyma flocculosa]